MAAVVVAALLLACRGSTVVPGSPATGGAAAVLDPDVPAWRGGCFFAGPPGKIVNGSPSPDVRPFGNPCGDPPSPGGLVYLDRYDPVAGTGDVTVLSSAAGSTPVVIGKRGGSGVASPGSTGARFDPAQRRVLTLEEVTFVTGNLVVADLPAGAPATTIASGVRAENYDFVSGGGVLYVGNYDPATRRGDLFHWDGSAAPRLLAAAASRFDFLMYRLSPDGSAVAYLRGYVAGSGGDLYAQALPPPPGATPPDPLASGAFAPAWTADGRQLTYRTLDDDGVTYRLWAWDGTGAPRPLATGAATSQVVGGDLLYATDWSVLAQSATLHLVPAGGGPAVLDAIAPASLRFAVAQPADRAGVLAYAALPAPSDPSTGDLYATPLARAAPVAIDRGVSNDAGFQLSPAAGFVVYAVGYARPIAAGSASPQPGIAAELRVAPVAGGAPSVLARAAATFVAWDPGDRYVAALEAFQPALDVGQLVVRPTGGGTALITLEDVGLGAFGFTPDGGALWALRGWDDALQRGELVLAPTGGAAAWQPTPVATDVTAVASSDRGAVVYAVRGGGRDGLWIAAAR